MKLDLDIEQFWKDEETTHKDNCFSPLAKQVACGIRMSDECVFAELGEEGEPWGYTPPERRVELNKRYNEKAIQIVGRPLLNEDMPEPDDSMLEVSLLSFKTVLIMDGLMEEEVKTVDEVDESNENDDQ